MNLLFDHGAVFAALRHQFGMRARLTDAAIFDDHDQVGAGDRAQAVSDDKTGATVHKRRQAFLNEPLAVGVQVAGRFVENE